MVSSAALERYERSLDLALHEKERREKKLEEDEHKLSRLKERLRDRLDGFLKGRQVKIRDLSRAFLKQAIVVDSEKKKLHVLRARLEYVKHPRFALSSSSARRN